MAGVGVGPSLLRAAGVSETQRVPLSADVMTGLAASDGRAPGDCRKAYPATVPSPHPPVAQASSLLRSIAAQLP